MKQWISTVGLGALCRVGRSEAMGFDGWPRCMVSMVEIRKWADGDGRMVGRAPAAVYTDGVGGRIS